MPSGLNDQVSTFVAKVTPNKAADWLGETRSQAKLRRSTVSAYAEEMASHRWKLNGEPIIFSQDGKVIDGRHRLAGCVEAGVPFPSLVIRGVDPSAYETVDTLRKRTVSDILTIRKLPSGRGLASALRQIWAYQAGDFADMKKKPPVQELLQLLSIYPELRDAEDEDGSILRAREVRDVLPLGTGIAFHFLFSQVSREKANDFFLEIATSKEGGEGPGALLRGAIQSMRDGVRGRVDGRTLRVYIIKAWNAYSSGSEISKLRYSPGRESFPDINGLAGLEVDFTATEAEIASAAEEPEELRVELKEVTPAYATAILEKHPVNRKAAPAVIDRYARDMRAESWQLNGQTIKVGRSGNLIDGQHRLHACIKAGVPFPAIFVYGVDDGAFDTFDLGAKKGYHQVLADRGEKRAAALAAALKVVWLHENGLLGNRNIQPTQAELDDVLVAHPNIRLSVRWISELQGLLPPAWAVALHYLLSEIDQEAGGEFFEQLSSGVGLQKGSPILLLRDTLMKAHAQKRIASNDLEKFVYVVKAWNAWKGDTPIRQLAWKRSGSAREGIPAIFQDAS